jgi:hypothetical protein
MVGTMSRLLLVIGLVLLTVGPAIADAANAQEPATPTTEETIPVSVPTVLPTEPPAMVETEVPTEEPESTEPPDVTEAATETDGAGDTSDAAEEEFELAPDTSGTPVTNEEKPAPTVEPAIPFAPVLECLPRETSGVATAGEGNWAVLECSIEWETADVNAVHLVARPRTADWRVALIDVDDPAFAEIPVPVRLESGDHELDLPNAAFTTESDSFSAATFLLSAQLGCSAALSTIVELEMTAESQLDDAGAAGLEETVIDEIELQGQPATAPDLHDLALSFSSIANSLDNRVSTGSLTLAYSGAPALCGWSISLGFADFTAGNYRIPATQLIATAVTGIEGALVTSDQGVLTIVIAEGSIPRAASGALQVTLELNIGSFLPVGNYQTVVTVDVAVMPYAAK